MTTTTSIAIILSTLLLQLLLPSVSSQLLGSTYFVPPPSLTIGWAGPLQLPNVDSIVFGHPSLIGFKLGIQYVNSRTDLLPGVRLNGVMNNTYSDPGLALFDGHDLGSRLGAVAVVGPFRMYETLQMQYAARFVQMPHCGPAASILDNTFDRSITYPYFFRLVPGITAETKLLFQLVEHLGFHQVALVSTTDLISVNGVKSFLSSTGNVTLLETVSFESGTTQFNFQMATLRASRASVFVFLGSSDDFRTFIRGAHEFGLVGEGYQWFVSHHASNYHLFTNATGELSHFDVADMSTGIIGLQYPTDRESTIYHELDQLFRAMPIDPDAASVHPEDLDIPIPINTLLAFDCVMQIAHGMHEAIFGMRIDPRLQKNRAKFLSSILNAHSFGATGPINLTSIGDRIMGMEIVNFHGLTNGGWVRVGDVSTTGEIDLNEGVVRWAGPLGLKPADTPPASSQMRHYFARDTVLAMFALAGIGISIGFICLALVVLNYHHSVIQTAAPPFLICIIIGAMTLCASIIPQALVTSDFAVPASINLCGLQLILVNIGYTGMIVAFLIKLHKIYRRKNLNHTPRIRWTDRRLFMVWCVGIIIEFAQLTLLNIGAPIQLVDRKWSDQAAYRVCDVAAESGYTINTLYQPVILSVRFTLLLLATCAAFHCRKIGKGFSESSQILFSMYNMTGLSVLLPVIELAAARGSDALLVAYCVCVFLIAVLTLTIMFMTKYRIILKKRNESTTPEVSLGRTMADELAAMRVAAALKRNDKEFNKPYQGAGVLHHIVESSHTQQPSPVKSPQSNGAGESSTRSFESGSADGPSTPPGQPNSSFSPDVSTSSLSSASSASSSSPHSISTPDSSLSPSQITMIVEMFRGVIDETEVHATIAKHAASSSHPHSLDCNSNRLIPVSSTEASRRSSDTFTPSSASNSELDLETDPTFSVTNEIPVHLHVGLRPSMPPSPDTESEPESDPRMHAEYDRSSSEPTVSSGVDDAAAAVAALTISSTPVFSPDAVCAPMHMPHTNRSAHRRILRYHLSPIGTTRTISIDDEQNSVTRASELDTPREDNETTTDEDEHDEI